MSPWVGVTRQETVKERDKGFWRHYVVDVVHRGYFKTFVYQHLMPLLSRFAERGASVESLSAEGKAGVADLQKWDCADLRPWKQ